MWDQINVLPPEEIGLPGLDAILELAREAGRRARKGTHVRVPASESVSLVRVDNVLA